VGTGTRANFSALEWAGLKAETRAHLIKAAGRQRHVFYKDVDDHIKDPRLNYKSAAMDDLLGEISEEEHADGRPLLSAVVVRNDLKLPIPGPGFFRLAKQLGSMPNDGDKVVFWRAEFMRVCRYRWGGTPAAPPEQEVTCKRSELSPEGSPTPTGAPA